MAGRRRGQSNFWKTTTNTPSANTSIDSSPEMSQFQIDRTAAPVWTAELRLSQQPTARLDVCCDLCSRRGRFTAFRLYAKFGDLSGPQLLHEIARDAGCMKAMRPPSVSSPNYMEQRCRIRVVRRDEEAVVVPTLARRMHEGWKLFITCDRHHQGLKSARPCPGSRTEMDLATLVASFGHDFAIANLGERLVAPCCQTRDHILYWQEPPPETAKPPLAGSSRT